MYVDKVMRDFAGKSTAVLRCGAEGSDLFIRSDPFFVKVVIGIAYYSQ
jgi:hypothetical protein